MLALQTILRGIATIGLMAIILFGGAGTFAWHAAWILLALFVCFFLAVGTWMLRYAPDLAQERLAAAKLAPRWDTLILRIYSLALVALLLVAALDAGRLHHSRVPLPLRALGFIEVLLASAIVGSCLHANRYLSSHARLQADRQQEVVRVGPYRFVRHPMYLGIIVLVFGIALSLGSWFALLPASLIAALFVIRTLLEDRMLASELSGYSSYAATVRYRLIPGLW